MMVDQARMFNFVIGYKKMRCIAYVAEYITNQKS